MIAALIVIVAFCSAFELLLFLISLMERMPAINKRTSAYLAQFPDDE